ncbi:uncharacterized protein KNAG_0A06530 [Huiozyma naganishii CBS 8797]|uniref:Uncharacterized protein n=1 Tax=Huiozyma naganishii (strain ATCC MYA-139 / BCRC 22969 / CBS 8797 / KCTC 17520 / NBRC 10181 / NCYC 3082 / Yp74L-3) TaxID=1071383 RepID=J7R0I2_HUIN7|nr:hypothetical protein KNAG_0A06530 [Kazachstania naganishii CBS 8797]CCK68310.1 hypothetical protein KNAG_0A06530 [Kazachstania naganishii CBS 8797]
MEMVRYIRRRNGQKLKLYITKGAPFILASGGVMRKWDERRMRTNSTVTRPSEPSKPSQSFWSQFGPTRTNSGVTIQNNCERHFNRKGTANRHGSKFCLGLYLYHPPSLLHRSNSCFRPSLHHSQTSICHRSKSCLGPCLHHPQLLHSRCDCSTPN